MNPLLEAILLGIVQGLTEFIPVSSSGHLLLFGELLQLSQSSFAFELALNIGTLLALIVYFFRELITIVKSVLKKQEKLWLHLIIATIPAVVIGGLFLPLISSLLRSPLIAIVALIVVGIIMIMSDKIDGERSVKDLSYTDAFIIGCGQVLAFIPGTSRSGITILAGRFRNLTHEQAARFSFLMAIPVIAAAIVRLAFEPELTQTLSDAGPLYVGIGVSFVSGLFAIGFMLRFLRRSGLKMFGYYRIVIALVVLFTMLIRGTI